MLLGLLITGLLPPGAPILLGADDTVARRSGRRIAANGGDRDAVRSTKQHVIHGCGVTWVAIMLLGPVPWSRRVGAWPCLTALGWPAAKHGRRRHQTSID
jgi:hypothetical protein